MPKLIFNDPETDHEVTLTLGESQPEVTVGRNPGNTLRVNNPSISRRHAKFVWENGEVTLYDLDSSNGSYVNGNRIRSQVLADGDRLRIGEFPVVFVDEADSATSEVSPDLIESVLQNHKQTSLGGFGPPEPPPMPDAFGQPEGYGPESYGFSNQGAPESPSTNWGDEAGFSMGGGGGLSFGEPSGGLVFPDEPAPQEWDDEPIELEPDLADDSEPDLVHDSFAHEVDLEMDDLVEEAASAASVADDDLDTRNAAPGEIASRLGGFARGAEIEEPYDATVERSLESIAELRAAASGMVPPPAQPEPAPVSAPAIVAPVAPVPLAAPVSVDMGPELAELQKQLDAVTKERDELADVLNNKVGDGNAANQLQIDRLRKERDRLSEERRNLMRQLTDIKKTLEEAPTHEAVATLESRVGDLERELSASQADVADLRDDVSSRDVRLEDLTRQLEQLRAIASDKEGAERYSAELGEQLQQTTAALDAARAEIADLREMLEETQGRLEKAFGEVESLDGELSERDQKLETLTDLTATLRADVSSRDAQIEDLRGALEEALTEGEARGERIAALEQELELRPMGDEVIDLRNRLTSTETARAELEAERNDLLAAKASLEGELAGSREMVDAINSRYAKVGAEIDGLRKERDDLKEERVAFARETDYLQVERRKLTDEVEDLRKKVKASDKEAKRKKQIFDELSADLRKLVQENNALQDKVKGLEERLQGAPRPERVTELESALAKATETITDLEQDAADLTRDLGQFSADKQELEARVEVLEAELEEAQAGAASGEEAARLLEEIRAEREQLAERVAELEPQLEALSGAAEELEGARASLEEAQAEVASLQAQLEVAQAAAVDASKVAEFKKKLDEAEETLANLILERDQLEDALKKAKG